MIIVILKTDKFNEIYYFRDQIEPFLTKELHMKPYIHKLLSFSIAFIIGFGAAGQNSAMTYGDIPSALKAISSDPSISQSVLSICIRTEDGQTLAEINPTTMLVPASNMKLITTGAALHTLGADYRYKTEIGYTGTIQDGTLNGNIHIIGGGDPTIGSKDSIAVNLNTTFAQWEKFIRNAGINNINGCIIGDGRWAEGMAEEDTWSYQDVGVYYGTGVTGLMFYENMLSFSAEAGKEIGAPVNITATYPNTPWMTIRNEAITGKAGIGDETYMFTSEFCPIAAIRGSFGIDRAKKRVDFSNKFPEYTCARYFEDYLKGKGIICSKGAADFKLKTGWIAETTDTTEITILGHTLSPTLKRIAFTTNHVSNNLYAETLFKTLGKLISGSNTYKASCAALEKALKDMGLNTDKGLQIKDGSGLSRQNYVSADFFCRFLKKMMESHAYDDFLYGLPQPGGNGSLQFNMKKYPVELRSRIRVKSGSMNGIRCYSGYVLPREKDGKIIIFSILTGNCTAPTWKTRQMLDKLMATIAEAN